LNSFGTKAFKSYAPFGQLPILRDGDLMLTQSGAIVRHLARKLCIDGSTEEEKALVDMYFELARDINMQKGQVYNIGADSAAKLRKFLSAAEAACADGKHFVGSSLTMADVAMFNTLYTLEELQPGCLGDHPQLKTFVTHFSSLPNVAAYLKSPRRIPITENEQAKGPSKQDGYRYVKPLRVESYAHFWAGP
jgi:glutathione S-transferase